MDGPWGEVFGRIKGGARFKQSRFGNVYKVDMRAL